MGMLRSYKSFFPLPLTLFPTRRSGCLRRSSEGNTQGNINIYSWATTTAFRRQLKIQWWPWFPGIARTQNPRKAMNILMPGKIPGPSKMNNRRSNRIWWRGKGLFQWVAIDSFIKTIETSSTQRHGYGPLNASLNRLIFIHWRHSEWIKINLKKWYSKRLIILLQCIFSINFKFYLQFFWLCVYCFFFF